MFWEPSSRVVLESLKFRLKFIHAPLLTTSTARTIHPQLKALPVAVLKHSLFLSAQHVTEFPAPKT